MGGAIKITRTAMSVSELRCEAKRIKSGSLFAAVSSGIAICPSGVMVLSEVTVIVLVRAS
jgi:hypothetical protein